MPVTRNESGAGRSRRDSIVRVVQPTPVEVTDAAQIDRPLFRHELPSDRLRGCAAYSPPYSTIASIAASFTHLGSGN
jgi:hypothetical protein